jgi:hypothetical protein
MMDVGDPWEYILLVVEAPSTSGTRRQIQKHISLRCGEGGSREIYISSDCTLAATYESNYNAVFLLLR